MTLEGGEQFMASIMDSFRDIFNDKYSFLKVIIFTLTVNYDYTLYLDSKNNPATFAILTFVTAFFLFWFLIKITSNIVNERTEVLPSLNPIKLGYTSCKGILSLLPMICLSCFLANLVCTRLHSVEWLDYIVKTLAWLIAVTIITSSYLMFASKERILDSFKLGVLSDKAGDMIASIILLIIQLTLVNGIVLGFLCYSIMILFGPGQILNFIISLAVIYDLCAIGHYIGQMHYEHVRYSRI